MKKLASLSATAAIAVLTLLPAERAAAAIEIAPVGGTVVVLTATPVLTGAGVSLAPLGIASAMSDVSGNAVAIFPITGGTLDPDLSNAKVEHEGSGLSLTRNSVTVSLENFLIDTTLPTDTIFGKVSVGTTTLPDPVPLFTLTGNNMFLSDAAGAALNSALGIPNLAGAQLGFALTNPVPVPEPETYAMMGLGLAFLALMRQSRKQKNSALTGRLAAA